MRKITDMICLDLGFSGSTLEQRKVILNIDENIARQMSLETIGSEQEAWPD